MVMMMMMMINLDITSKITKFTKVVDANFFRCALNDLKFIRFSIIVPCSKHSSSSACSPPDCRQRGKEQLRSALKMSRRLGGHWCLWRRELLIDVGGFGSLHHTCDGFLCFPVGLTLILPKEEPSLLVEASLYLP